jgi:hypothetical protein
MFEVLRQRKILTDSKTGKVINEDTQLQTLLKIIQNEKYHDNIETKRVTEAFPSVNKLKTLRTFPYCTSAYNLWYKSYCYARDLITEVIMTWLLLLAINPLRDGFIIHSYLVGLNKLSRGKRLSHSMNHNEMKNHNHSTPMLITNIHTDNNQSLTYIVSKFNRFYAARITVTYASGYIYTH